MSFSTFITANILLSLWTYEKSITNIKWRNLSDYNRNTNIGKLLIFPENSCSCTFLDSIILSFTNSVITISKFIFSDKYYIHYYLWTMNNKEMFSDSVLGPVRAYWKFRSCLLSLMFSDKQRFVINILAHAWYKLIPIMQRTIMAFTHRLIVSLCKK